MMKVTIGICFHEFNFVGGDDMKYSFLNCSESVWLHDLPPFGARPELLARLPVITAT